MTDKQQAILDFIRACDGEGEPPPTIREIMDTVGISSTSVVDYHLGALTRAGYITRNRTVSRGIRLAGKASSKLSELAEALRVVQVQIADLQAEMKRLRQTIKAAQTGESAHWVPNGPDQPAPSEADWQAMNRLARG